MASLEGWYGLQLVQASDATGIKGLGHSDVAERVKAGTLPPTTPLFVGRKRVGGGYPDLVVCVVLEPDEVTRWRLGDRSIVGPLCEQLEDAVAEFWEERTSQAADA